MTRADERLDGTWAIVTGASMGIGRAIARELVDAGANVVLVARGADELARSAAELTRDAGQCQQVLTRTVDISSPTEIASLFDWASSALPRLDTFVANAGTGQTRPLLELELDEWQRMLDLNLTGTVLCCQGAARLMARHDGPDRSILVISSIRVLQATPGRLAYSTTKAAVNQMVRVAAAELAPLGIRVNCLSPGITDTPLTRQFPEEFAAAVAKVPLGRAGEVDDMAGAARFLCGPRARFMTGTNLVVDGGESLPGR
jgi:3-oxoacyl-[acyl-carrier protein] reductase